MSICLKKINERATGLRLGIKSGNAVSGKIVPISAWRNLAEDLSKEMRPAVIIGKTGTGKTKLFNTLRFSHKWEVFGERFAPGYSFSYGKAQILPLFSTTDKISLALEPETKESIIERQTGIWPSRPSLEGFKKFLGDFPQDSSDADWRLAWHTLFLQVLDAKAKPGETIEAALKRRLGEQKIPVVLLVDDLEELFTDWEGALHPLRVFLQEVIKYIHAWSRGMVTPLVFVHEHTVRRAITQNFGQFCGKYSSYRLEWSPEDIFELAAWIITGKNMFDTMFFEKKRVLQALVDGKNEISPMDVVNWICESVQRQIEANDKINVTTKNFNEGLAAASARKILRMREQIPLFDKIADSLFDMTMPVPKNLEQASLLEELGVIVRMEQSYIFPEIFRRGFGIKIRKGDERKVAAHLKKTLRFA